MVSFLSKQLIIRARRLSYPIFFIEMDGKWDMLWKIEAPPKVKNFVWRVCRNCLPTRSRLGDKGVNCRSLCCCCDNNIETSCHLFFACSLSRNVWIQKGLWNYVDECLTEGECFAEVFFLICDKLSKASIIKFVMNLWSILQARNNKVWEGKEDSPQAISSRANSYWRVMGCSKDFTFKSQTSNSETHGVSWCKPPMGFIKCNIDAAFPNDSNITRGHVY